ncbi:MAG: GntP family permease [Bacteroidales bacterium]|nr:GntP family permease [Candidatus Cacconaster caballi]
MNGIFLTAVFIAAMALMILSISKWKVHPFLAIIGVALLMAIAVGLPLDTIPTTLGKGFSSIFVSIGLVIIFGTIIGQILEKTGAALRLADTVLKILGPRHPQLAVMIIGWIVSIPVFCDSGFIIVNPIRRNLSRRTGVSSVSLTVALSAGLYAAHVLIPPTPGPVAAAGMVGLENNLLSVIGIGAAISVFTLLPTYFFAKKVGRKVKSADENGTGNAPAETYEQTIDSFGTLPSTAASLLPIIVPIVLMAAGSIASMSGAGSTFAGTLATFLGKPVIALICGTLFALIPLLRTGKASALYEITQESLKTAGPIIFITAAGSVLGQVIMDAGFVGFIQDNASVLSAAGIFFPFAVAAILKTAVGSSTVALTTTAGIMGMFDAGNSIMAALGYTSPLGAALVVMAIGAGAMTVSHANDSYFWVVTNFGGMTPEDGYRIQTVMSLIMGLSTITAVFLLSLILL